MNNSSSPLEINNAIRSICKNAGMTVFRTYTDKRTKGKRVKFCIIEDQPENDRLFVKKKVEQKIAQLGLAEQYTINFFRSINVASGRLYWCMTLHVKAS